MTTAVVVTLLTLLFGIQPISTDLYLPALPTLRHELGTSIGAAQFTLSALIICFGFGQLLCGPLADRFGRRPVLLGIETMSSCQDAGESLADLPVEYPHMAAYVEAERGWAYIDFLPFYGIGPFMDAIRAARPTDEMWRRMSHWTNTDAWQKRLHLHPIDDHFQPFGAQLLFPVYDIPEMVGCLEKSVP